MRIQNFLIKVIWSQFEILRIYKETDVTQLDDDTLGKIKEARNWDCSQPYLPIRCLPAPAPTVLVPARAPIPSNARTLSPLQHSASTKMRDRPKHYSPLPQAPQDYSLAKRPKPSCFAHSSKHKFVSRLIRVSIHGWERMQSK
ncbi:hypothetical protein PM082_007309 [Marasmius tenuissimus]|nr:hypothetical protein PM082_007309 [Marasmius tenuissimus]